MTLRISDRVRVKETKLNPELAHKGIVCDVKWGMVQVEFGHLGREWIEIKYVRKDETANFK